MALVSIKAFDAVYGVKEAEICNKALGRIGAELIKDTLEDTKQSRSCKAVYAQTRDELIRMFPFNFSVKTAYLPRDASFVSPLNKYQYAYKLFDYIDFPGDADESDIITGVSGIVDFPSMIGREVFGDLISEGTRIIAADEDSATITLDRPTEGEATSFSSRIPILKILQIDANNDSLYEIIRGGAERRILCDSVSEIFDEVEYLEMKYCEQVVDPSKFDPIFLDALALRVASKIALPMTNKIQISSKLEQEFAAIMRMAQNSTLEESQYDTPDQLWTESSRSLGGVSRYGDYT